MLTAVLSFLGVSVIGIALDWLACTRLAAYRTNCEYRYRPRAVRYGLLVFAAAVFAYVKATYNPARQPILGLLILTVILLAWAKWRREMFVVDLFPLMKRRNGTRTMIIETA